MKEKTKNEQCTSCSVDNKTCVLVSLGIGTIIMLVLIFIAVTTGFNQKDGTMVAGFNIKNINGEIDCDRFLVLYDEVLEPNIEEKKLQKSLKNAYDVCSGDELGVSLPKKFDIFRK